MAFYNQPYGNQPYSNYSQVQAPGWQNQQYSLPQDGFNQPPTKPKKNRKPLIAGIIIIIIAILAGTSSYILFFSRIGLTTPASIAVSNYLHALNDNDAEKALSYSLTDPPNKDFLTNEILAKEIPAGSMTSIHASNSYDTKGKDPAEVYYSFRLKGKSIKGTYKVDKSDDSWKLETAVLNIKFNGFGDTIKKLQSLTIWGKPVKGDLSKIYVFPGELQFGSSIPGVVIKTRKDSDFEPYGFTWDYSEPDKRHITMSTDLDDATRNKYKGIITQRARDCLMHGFQGKNCPTTSLDTNQPIKKIAIYNFKIKIDQNHTGKARFSFPIWVTVGNSYNFKTLHDSVSGKFDFTGKQITYSFDK